MRNGHHWTKRYSDRIKRLLHERPVVLHAVAHSVRDWLGSLADQYVVGSWGGAGADTEQRIERGMPCSAPIEAEHELVEGVLEGGYRCRIAATGRARGCARTAYGWGSCALT